GIYKNVMELLVEEEVVRQFNALPPRVSSYINPTEWAAYALNQLPPLYATSEKGVTHQLRRGKSQHGVEVKQAVQRALAAVRRDPLCSTTPLPLPQAPSQEILARLRFLLRNERLEWEAVPLAVEQALEQSSHGGIYRPPSVRTPAVYRLEGGSSPFPYYGRETATPPFASLRPPASSKSASSKSVSPKAAKETTTAAASPLASSAPDEPFGWDDPLYNPR
ncbi:MAG: late competence development ComFB family protein, partial [Elainella sp.]